MADLYFSPPEAALRGLGLSSYEKFLLSRLIQTLRLGVYVSQKKNGTAGPIDHTHTGAAKCEAYIKSALSSEMLSDKLFPLRHTGSSMQFILQNLPVPSHSSQLSAMNIFQLCIWRTFAFGNSEYLQMTKIKTDDKPDLEKLHSIIQKWGNGPLKLSVPAYGQLQIIKAKIPIMLSSFWELSKEIFASQKPQSTPPSFATLHERLLSRKISSIPRHGLIAWLLTSDFFEYGLCQPPTIQDLAEHITSSGTSGPKGAMKIVAEKTGQPAPETADELAKVLGNVFGLLQNPPQKSPTIMKVVAGCEKVQGRELAVVDLEHALCKISRQDTRAKTGKGNGKGAAVKGKGGMSHGPNRMETTGQNEYSDGDEGNSMITGR
ncbi:hypothetical protein BKA65DRAFT_554552 [Rhexocercosporidium sp. MPI-PUGE-AT-0058]|nr:hypothetical protein BKA65DRAFT_554552 [Rhexocercosporidium sp. MPI-PUGE-AT-0058]